MNAAQRPALRVAGSAEEQQARINLALSVLRQRPWCRCCRGSAEDAIGFLEGKSIDQLLVDGGQFRATE